MAIESLKWKLTTPPKVAFPNFGEPFLVETNVSSVAVGAVLAQNKEDRRTHRIQYASPTMSQAERKYSACEREALAAIFSLKKSRVFLLSSGPFTLVTD